MPDLTYSEIEYPLRESLKHHPCRHLVVIMDQASCRHAQKAELVLVSAIFLRSFAMWSFAINHSRHNCAFSGNRATDIPRENDRKRISRGSVRRNSRSDFIDVNTIVCDVPIALKNFLISDFEFTIWLDEFDISRPIRPIFEEIDNKVAGDFSTRGVGAYRNILKASAFNKRNTVDIRAVSDHPK